MQLNIDLEQFFIRVIMQQHSFKLPPFVDRKPTYPKKAQGRKKRPPPPPNLLTANVSPQSNR